MRQHHRPVDVSVETSGPHDFAVRRSVVRLTTPRRPSHPAPNVRDDREAPLLIGRGTARGYRDDLPDGQSEIFLARGVDSRIGVDWAGEIRFLAQGLLRHSLGRRNGSRECAPDDWLQTSLDSTISVGVAPKFIARSGLTGARPAVAHLWD
jgi:hypothetical protein